MTFSLLLVEFAAIESNFSEQLDVNGPRVLRFLRSLPSARGQAVAEARGDPLHRRPPKAAALLVVAGGVSKTSIAVRKAVISSRSP